MLWTEIRIIRVANTRSSYKCLATLSTAPEGQPPVHPKHLVILQEAVGRLLITRAVDKCITTMTLCKGNSAYTDREAGGSEMASVEFSQSNEKGEQLDDQVAHFRCPQRFAGDPAKVNLYN